MKIFKKVIGLTFFDKGPFFSGLSPSKLKKCSTKIKGRAGYVYIEESFDTIFNMGRENHPWAIGLI